jgi:tetratricopeptide (TPR) repeat protein
LKIQVRIFIYCLFLISCNSLFSDNRDDIYKKNVIEYTEQIKKNPDHAENYFNRGIGYNLLKQPDKALIDFEKAIELNKDFEDAYWKKSLIMLDKKKYYEALESIDKAIHIRGENIPLVYYTIRGKCYFGLKMADESIKDFSKIIDSGPDEYYNKHFLDSLYHRAVLYSIKKEYNKSLHDLYKLTEFAEPGSNVLYILGVNYYELNQTEKAIENFNKVVKTGQNLSKAYMHLSLCYIKNNDKKKSEENYINFLKNDCSDLSSVYDEEFVVWFSKDRIDELVRKYCKD